MLLLHFPRSQARFLSGFAVLSLTVAVPGAAQQNTFIHRPIPTVHHVVGTSTVVSVEKHRPGQALVSLVAPAGITYEVSDAFFVLGGGSPGTAVVEAVFSGENKPRSLAVVISDRPLVPFELRPTGSAQSVSVVGGFNGWSAGRNRLEKDSDGVFRALVPLDPGTYEYKFVVDGNWIPDPGNPEQKPDGFQGFNSIITVEGGDKPAGRLIQLRRKGAKFTVGVDSLTTGPAPSIAPDSVLVMLGDQIIESAEVTSSSITVDLQGSGPHAVRVFARDTEQREIVPAEFIVSDVPTWRDEILYFVFTDRFRDGNKENNAPVKHPQLAPQANFLGGDWDGIRQSIEEGYFTNLGVTALWISPPQRQPAEAWQDAIPPNRFFTGYHGYWPVAPREVDPRFGTTESLKLMVKAAHEKGIKVIMDCVANHVHSTHPYYLQNPGWFGQYDLADGRKNVRLFDEFPLTTWFDTFLPKFDYDRNPEAVKTMVDDMIWWLETFNFDGFRHDATKHIPDVFWFALTDRIRELEAKRGSHIYQVGESITGRDLIMDYVNRGMMDGQFDFPLYWPIRGVFASQAEGFDSLVRAMEDNRRVYGGFSIHSAFVGNHDFARFMAFASGDVPPGGEREQQIGWDNPPKQPEGFELYDRLMMAHTFVMAQPNQVPLIYYGDEWGLTGAGDPDNRRMMKFGDDVPVKAQGVIEHVSRLTDLRKKHPALRDGDSTVLSAGQDHMALLRSTFDQRIILLWNRTNQSKEIEVTLPGWANPGSSRERLSNLLENDVSFKRSEDDPNRITFQVSPRTSALFLLP